MKYECNILLVPGKSRCSKMKVCFFDLWLLPLPTPQLPQLSFPFTISCSSGFLYHGVSMCFCFIVLFFSEANEGERVQWTAQNLRNLNSTESISKDSVDWPTKEWPACGYWLYLRVCMAHGKRTEWGDRRLGFKSQLCHAWLCDPGLVLPFSASQFPHLTIRG